MRKFLAVAILLATIVPGGTCVGNEVAELSVAATYECVTPGVCDTVRVLVNVSNQSAEEIAGCFATLLTWHYEPTDSLRTLYGARIDSLERAGMHACRWHPVSYRTPPLPTEEFPCEKLSLAPGESVIDSVRTGTGARDFRDYPGFLNTVVTVCSGQGGSTWSDVDTVGVCELKIPVP